MPDPARETPLQPHVFQILISLIGGPKHGYSIIKDIRDRTGGRLELGTSTLYTTVRRLMESAMIQEVDRPAGEESTDSRRRYYDVTDFGVEVAREEARRIRSLDAQAESAGLLERKPARRGAR